jgi:hypothetical protein
MGQSQISLVCGSQENNMPISLLGYDLLRVKTVEYSHRQVTQFDAEYHFAVSISAAHKSFAVMRTLRETPRENSAGVLLRDLDISDGFRRGASRSHIRE